MSAGAKEAFPFLRLEHVNAGCLKGSDKVTDSLQDVLLHMLLYSLFQGWSHVRNEANVCVCVCVGVREQLEVELT